MLTTKKSNIGSHQTVVHVNSVFEPAAIQGIRFAAWMQQFVPQVTHPPTQPETRQTLGKQTGEREREKKNSFNVSARMRLFMCCLLRLRPKETLERGKVQIVFHLAQREGIKHLKGREA